MKIAVMGLGIMGRGMADRLIGGGFDVAVYNRNPEKSAAFAGRARVYATPDEAAVDADIIISMLADDIASGAVWDGVFSRLKPGAICIESSTVSLDWVKTWAAQVEAHGGHPIDAPVTGSKAAAESGQLVFIAGGDLAAIERARPAFEAMGKSVVPLGATGSGCLFKLINNFMCGVQLASLGEALAMVERGGLDQAKALDLLTSGAPGSPLVKLVAPRMAAEDYTPNFFLALMAKDLGYAVNEGAKLKIGLRTGEAAHEQFSQAIAAGFGEKDISAIAAFLKSR